MHERPTKLYRHFDAEGHLLYVGVSLSAVARLNQHMDVSHWSDTISEVRVETLPDRNAALAAETVAIQSENPKHNIRKREQTRPEKIAKDTPQQELFRHVAIKPCYSFAELTNVTSIGPAKLKAFIEAGLLKTFSIGSRKFVTGWQLIDFLESLANE
jgi:excinuclease UvrABC nuclease subunit